jgi:hypothetical protein
MLSSQRLLRKPNEPEFYRQYLVAETVILL